MAKTKTKKKTSKRTSKNKSKKSVKKAKKTSRPTPSKRSTPGIDKTNIQIKDVEIEKETKNLVWIIVGIIAIFVLFFAIRFLIPSPDVLSIDQMHKQNLAGEIGNDTAYVYNGFSFVKVGDLWYTQLQKGNTIYDVTFNYAPKDIEDIPVEGSLNKGFIEATDFYITFDPEGSELKYVAVANYGLSNSLVRAFGFNLQAGCLKNVTEDCATAQIITCDDKDKNVFYFKEGKEAKVIFEDNCIILQGEGNDLVRVKDRLLLRWYNILR